MPDTLTPSHASGSPARGVRAEAWASPGFRWLLRWRWAPGPVMVFVGLNPSTADAFTSDHTARRAWDFAKREHCGGMAWVNLVPFIATDPKAMRARLAADPQEPPLWRECNDAHIFAAVTGPDVLVVNAWGSNAAHPLVEPHRWHVHLRLCQLGVTQHCLGITKTGQPAHPLRLAADAELTEFWPRYVRRTG